MLSAGRDASEPVEPSYALLLPQTERAAGGFLGTGGADGHLTLTTVLPSEVRLEGSLRVRTLSLRVGAPPSRDLEDVLVGLSFRALDELDERALLLTADWQTYLGTVAAADFAAGDWWNVTLSEVGDELATWRPGFALVLDLFHAAVPGASPSSPPGSVFVVADASGDGAVRTVDASDAGMTSYFQQLDDTATVSFRSEALVVRVTGDADGGDPSCGSVGAETVPDEAEFFRLAGTDDEVADCEADGMPGCRTGASLVAFEVPAGATHPELAGHAGETAVLLFGGQQRERRLLSGGRVSDFVNDLWLYAPWYRREAEELFGGGGGGGVPASSGWVLVHESDCFLDPWCSAFHTMVVVGGRALVYGGEDEDSFLGRLEALDLGTLEWEVLPGPHPAGRYRHSAAAVGADMMFVFGGLGLLEDPDSGDRAVTSSSQVLAYNATSGAWADLSPPAVYADPADDRGLAGDLSLLYCHEYEEAVLEPAAGRLPCLHGAAAAFDGAHVYVAAGVVERGFTDPNDPSTSSFSVTNALHRLDPATGTLETVLDGNCASGVMPACRSDAAAASAAPGAFTLVGGVARRDGAVDLANDVWEYDASRGTWLRRAESGCGSTQRPPCAASAAAAATAATAADAGTVLLFGGEQQRPGLSQLGNRLTMLAPPPVLLPPVEDDEPLPRHPAAGGAEIDLRGTHFGGAPEVVLTVPATGAVSACANATVSFDAAAAPGAPQTVRCLSPPGAGAEVFACVRAAAGAAVLQSSCERAFAYQAPLVLSAAAAGAGDGPPPLPSDGNATLEVSGANFGPASAGAEVRVGGVECAATEWVSDALVRCTTRRGAGAGLAVTVAVGGQESAPAAGAVVSYEAPAVASVEVAPGGALDTLGGALVTLRGTGFGYAGLDAEARLGGRPCASTTVLNSTSCVCEAPPGAGAALPVTLLVGAQESTPGGAAAEVSYRAPSLYGLSFPPAPPSGGTPLTVRGASFGPDAAAVEVRVGEAACGEVALSGDGELVCVVPPLPAGSAGSGLAVTVRAGGQEGSAAANVSSDPGALLFSYASPVVGGASWDAGGAGGVPTTGGTVVEVSGASLGTAASPPAVTVGGVPCEPLEFVSDALVRCPAPPGAGAGLVVALSLGGVQRAAPQLFSYDAPAVAAVVPAASAGALRARGGERLTVEGSNFGPDSSGAARVLLGALECEGPERDPGAPHSRLFCTAPPGAGAGLAVRVSAGGQEGDASGAAAVSYAAPRVYQAAGADGPLSTAGGTRVTLRGDDLGGTAEAASAAATVGGRNCTRTEWLSPELVVCVAPPGAGASLALSLAVGGQAPPEGFSSPLASYAAPSVESVRGGESRGSPLTVDGASFGPGPPAFPLSLSVGGAPCEPTTYVSQTRALCGLPAALTGSGLGVVAEAGGQASAPEAGAASARYSYPAPEVASTSPAALRPDRRRRVTVRGEWFGTGAGGVAVTLDGAACVELSLVSDGELSCTAPSFATERDVWLVVSSGGQRSAAFRVPVRNESAPGWATGLVYALAALLQALFLASGVVVVVYREAPVVKAASVMFLVIALCGAALSLVPAYTLHPDSDSDWCHLSLASLAVGFSLTFGSLFLKNYRMLHIFQTDPGRLRKRVIYDSHLVAFLALFVGVDLVFVALISSRYECGSFAEGATLVLFTLLAVYKLVLLLAGVVVAYRARVVNIARFNERQQLGYAIYNYAVLILVLLPASLAVGDSASTRWLLGSLSLCFVLAVVVGILMVPKFIVLRAGGGSDTMSSTHSTAGALAAGSGKKKGRGAPRYEVATPSTTALHQALEAQPIPPSPARQESDPERTPETSLLEDGVDDEGSSSAEMVALELEAIE